MLNIIDHGTGNIASINNLLDSIKVDYQLASEPKFRNTSHIIIPGVGHFASAVSQLNQHMDKLLFRPQLKVLFLIYFRIQIL